MDAVRDNNVLFRFLFIVLFVFGIGCPGAIIFMAAWEGASVDKLYDTLPAALFTGIVPFVGVVILLSLIGAARYFKKQ